MSSPSRILKGARERVSLYERSLSERSFFTGKDVPAVPIKKKEEPADPRTHLFEFFRAGDERGPMGVLRNHKLSPKDPPTTDFFSVWRPTSLDAINMMMDGKATGKGLNVKGKSAKKGVLSGYVPFLQISREEDKTKVGTSPPDSTLRVYYATEALREAAREALMPVLERMVEDARAAQIALMAEAERGDDGDDQQTVRHASKDPAPRARPSPVLVNASRLVRSTRAT